MGDKILVTGATGFVGAAVVRALLALGRPVRALVRPEASLRNLHGLAVEFAPGRLEAPDSLAAAVAGCRAVIHVAADYRIWVPHPESMLRANVEGTRNLMRAALAAGVEKIVHTSSVAVLGHASEGPADEATPSVLADMIGPYKRSKFLAEAEVRRMVATEGLPAVIVNPSTPVGPGDIKPTPTGRMVAEAAAGRMPAYVETGLNIVHVDDVAAGHLLALEKGRIGERYILGGDNLTLAAILGIIAGLSGHAAPKLRLPRRALFPLALAAEGWARLAGGEPMLTVDALRMAAHPMWFASTKAESELGYRHRPAAEALADAVAWFAGAGGWRPGQAWATPPGQGG